MKNNILTNFFLKKILLVFWLNKLIFSNYFNYTIIEDAFLNNEENSILVINLLSSAEINKNLSFVRKNIEIRFKKPKKIIFIILFQEEQLKNISFVKLNYFTQ